jgi:UDP-N-acetylmuramyl pentapeptide phosphotransferase/UDP-N-acetylglucosamine-1-phosphate transferase
MLWIPLIAAVTCLLCLCLLKRHAIKLRLMDEPGVRKVHKEPVPRVGGLAILLGWVAALAVWQWAHPSTWTWLQELVAAPVQAAQSGAATAGLTDTGAASATAQGPASPALATLAQQAELPAGLGYTGVTLLIAVLLMGLLGLLDDRLNLRARHKLGAQLLVATALCASGLRLETIQFTQGAYLHLGDWSWPITILWLVGVTNAINLIDGLDGLAGGIAALTIAVLAYIGWDTGNQDLLILSLTMLGGLAVFLRYNWHPAKAYLGDAGSLSMGMFCAGGTLMALQGQPRYDNLLLPVIAMSVALGDMVISVLRRILERRSPLAPDRGHIHHVLLGLGLRTARAASVLHLCAGAGVLLAWTGRDGNGIFRMFSITLGMTAVLGMFWGVGYLRVRETMRAWREASALNRGSKVDQRSFEDAQLEIRETESADAWWGCLVSLAQAWHLQSLRINGRALHSMQYVNISGNSSRVPGEQEGEERIIFCWSHEDVSHAESWKYVEMEGIIQIPAGGEAFLLRASLPGLRLGFEQATRRFALLGRLIEGSLTQEIIEKSRSMGHASSANVQRVRASVSGNDLVVA